MLRVVTLVLFTLLLAYSDEAAVPTTKPAKPGLPGVSQVQKAVEKATTVPSLEQAARECQARPRTHMGDCGHLSLSTLSVYVPRCAHSPAALAVLSKARQQLFSASCVDGSELASSVPCYQYRYVETLKKTKDKTEKAKLMEAVRPLPPRATYVV